MKKHVFFISMLIMIMFSACKQPGKTLETKYADGVMISLSKEQLKEKIKGGWAGQVIGCTYGGPTEFQFNGTFIGDQVPISWDENQMIWWYENWKITYL